MAASHGFGWLTNVGPPYHRGHRGSQEEKGNAPLKKKYKRGTRVAPSFGRPTLDLGSGHDLRVHEFEPHLAQSLLGILSLPLSAPPPSK